MIMYLTKYCSIGVFNWRVNSIYIYIVDKKRYDHFYFFIEQKKDMKLVLEQPIYCLYNHQERIEYFPENPSNQKKKIKCFLF